MYGPVHSETIQAAAVVPFCAFDVVVIAASAGGIGPLARFLATLPASFPAPIVVVQHLPESSVYSSRLDEILRRATRLPVAWAREGESLAPGTVYLAPQDKQTALDSHTGCILLTPLPLSKYLRRPADALFRSAALTLGSRVFGIVLSGVLTDGAEGARAIAEAGGRVLVQHHQDAEFGDMPRAAMLRSHVGFAYTAENLAHVASSLIMAPGAAAWFAIGKAGVCSTS